MLSYQVEYQNMLENKRAHRASEAINWYQTKEQARHNVAQEQQWSAELGETSRHNVMQEYYSQKNIDESVRHNKKTEKLSSAQNKENIRHNKKTEGIQKGTVKESIRHNKATEGENYRHNVATESLSAGNLQLGWGNLALGQNTLSETARSHMRNEELTEYGNTTKRYEWAEDKRHNRATEDVQQYTASSGRMDAETRRSEYEWSVDKYQNYQYPLESSSTKSQNFVNYSSGVRNYSNVIDEWIGPTAKEKRSASRRNNSQAIRNYVQVPKDALSAWDSFRSILKP